MCVCQSERHWQKTCINRCVCLSVRDTHWKLLTYHTLDICNSSVPSTQSSWNLLLRCTRHSYTHVGWYAFIYEGMRAYPPTTQLSVNEKNPRNPLTSRCVTLFLPVKFTTCLPISHHIGLWLIRSDWGERTDINHLHKSCLASHTMAGQPKHCVTQTDDERDRQRESAMNQLNFRQFKCLTHSRCMEVWEFNSNYWIILRKISYKHSWSSEDEAGWLRVDTLTSSSTPVQAYHFIVFWGGMSQHPLNGLISGWHLVSIVPKK